MSVVLRWYDSYASTFAAVLRGLPVMLLYHHHRALLSFAAADRR